ncbi:hypothetical protein [Endozoicomonas sp. 2B-B]
MIGTLTTQGVINGCKMEDGELMYLVSKPGDSSGTWLPARLAIQSRQSFAERYRYRPLRSLEFGRKAQAEM